MNRKQTKNQDIKNIIKKADFMNWVLWYDSRHNVEVFCDVYTTSDKEFSEKSELEKSLIKEFAIKLNNILKNE